MFIAEIAEHNGGSKFRWAREVEERNRLWKARHDIYWATLQTHPGYRAIITDVCVPITCLPKLIADTKQDIQSSGVTGSKSGLVFDELCSINCSRYSIHISNFHLGPILGHVGDGNFHSFLLFKPEDRHQFEIAEQVAKRMIQ